MLTLLMLAYNWKNDPSTLYWYVFFGSAIVVSIAAFYGATSEPFENWRKRMVERYDRSKLAQHMQRAATSFAPKKKNGKTKE